MKTEEEWDCWGQREGLRIERLDGRREDEAGAERLGPCGQLRSVCSYSEKEKGGRGGSACVRVRLPLIFLLPPVSLC